jgi:hypothetical protein
MNIIQMSPFSFQVSFYQFEHTVHFEHSFKLNVLCTLHLVLTL